MRKYAKIIISLVLIAVMVFLLPASEAKAARGKVALGENKNSTASAFQIEVGESKDLNFYGASGYVYKTDAGSIFWKTSDSKIVTVDRQGRITGIAPGSATITVTVTVAKTRVSYEGSAVVTVVGAEGSFRLVAYDRGILQYSSVKDAETALKKGVEVFVTYTGGTPNKVYPTVSIDKENNKILNIDLTYLKGRKYIIKAEGLDPNGYETVVTWDSVPSYATLRYENTYLSETGGKDITGKSLATCNATPVFELYDSNGIVIGRSKTTSSSATSFVPATGVPSGKLRFTSVTKAGSGTLMSTGSGVVRLSKLADSVTLYATWTSDDNKTKITSPEILVSATPYVAPDLGGYVEGVTISNKVGNDIDWTGSETWTGSIPAGTTGNIVFYFRGDDGKKYSGATNATKADDIETLDPTSYRFFYEFADKSMSNKASISSTNGYFNAFDEGDVVVYIWQCEKGKTVKTANAALVGHINITITESPELYSANLEEWTYSVDHTASNKTVSIVFELFDQYGEPFTLSTDRRSNIIFRADDNAYAVTGTPSITWNKNKGTLTYNMAGKSEGTYTYHIVYGQIIDETVDIIVY